jgi:hypothetical protein
MDDATEEWGEIALTDGSCALALVMDLAERCATTSSANPIGLESGFVRRVEIVKDTIHNTF